MYLEDSCPIPWRLRKPLERMALALPTRESPVRRLEGLRGAALLTVVAAGDLSMERMPSYEAADILNDTQEFWESADVRVANLESQCTDRTEPAIPAKGMRAPGDAARFVAAAGLDAVTVANNHALDFGSQAFQESRRRVLDVGVSVTGYVEEGQHRALPAVLERKGLRVGMLSWCDDYRPPQDEPIAARPATLPDEAGMLAAVRELRGQTDVVVVQLHWGYEFALHPLLRHRDLARRVAEAGAQAVLCHHAHVPMAFEIYENSLIAHGLGNWIFADRPYFRNSHDWTFRSFLLKAGVGPEGVHWVEAMPFEIGADSRIHQMKDPARTKFLARVSRLNRRLRDDDWLQRAQTCRTIYETVNAVEQISSAPPERLREKARRFAIPLEAGLIAGLRTFAWPSASAVADWFESLALAADDPAELERIRSSGQAPARAHAADLAGRYRWTDAFQARIP